MYSHLLTRVLWQDIVAFILAYARSNALMQIARRLSREELLSPDIKITMQEL